jgi:hypothetical protein
MNRVKVVLGAFLALAVVLLGAWLWGRSGRGDLTRALQASELRNDLLEGRGSVLDARLALYNVNFGDASAHLENARTKLSRAEEQLKNLGRQDDIRRLQSALQDIDEAQRLSGQLDQSGNVRAAEAAKIINDMLGLEGKR